MPNAGPFGEAEVEAKPDAAAASGSWDEDTLQPGSNRPRRSGDWQETTTDDIAVPMLVMLVGKNAGRAIPLEEDLLIGRSRDASLVIDRDDVSRRHAIIWKSPEGDFLLQDLDSRNGTRVNGLPIKKKVLGFGDVVTIGRSAILLFTRREQLEAPLREFSDIESLGRVNGGVVDDFNNLLGVIIGNVSYLKQLCRTGDQSLASSALESLSDTEAAAKRAATITDKLISFAHDEEELRRMGLEGQADRLIKRESSNPGVRAMIREALEVLTGSRLPSPDAGFDGVPGEVTREYLMGPLSASNLNASPGVFDDKHLPSFYQAVAAEWTRESGIEPPPDACLRLANILEDLNQPESAAQVACRGALSRLGTQEERDRAAGKAFALCRKLGKEPPARLSEAIRDRVAQRGTKHDPAATIALITRLFDAGHRDNELLRMRGLLRFDRGEIPPAVEDLKAYAHAGGQDPEALERLRIVFGETAAVQPRAPSPAPKDGVTVSEKPLGTGPSIASPRVKSWVPGPPEPKDDLALALLPRYRLIKKLGSGGMGEVHLAEDVELGRNVAIKVLQRSLATDLFISKFKEEARIVAQLTHPGIVSIFDLGQRGHWSYIVMEYVDGPDLATLVNTSRAFPWTRLLQIVSTVAEAMAYAHRQGVIHRDLKPANILVGAHDHPKVTDFGIAKVLQRAEKDTAFSAAGLQVGTVSYMAPEQIRGNGVDQRTDLYLLGTTLYLCLAGTFPYVGDTIAAQKLETDAMPIRLRVPTVSEDLDRCVMRSLERSPEARFSTMLEFAEALRRTPEARGIVSDVPRYA